MPSGPKKRKANKKKENQPYSSHGEDMKQQDAKTSDNLNVSAENSHPSLSADEKERNRLDPSSGDELRFGGSGGSGELAVEEGSASSVEKGFKIGDGLDTINGKDNGEKVAARKSYNEGSMGSVGNRGKSDVELNRQAEVDVTDSVKSPDSLSRSSAEADNVSGSGLEVVAQVQLDHTPGNAAVPYQFQAQVKVNGDRKPTLVDHKVNTSMPHMNAVGSEWEDKAVVYPTPTDNTTTESSPIKTQEQHVGLSASSYNAAIVDGDEEEKDSGENEPLLSSSHYPVEKSSWKSCCGLSEVFSRSTA